MPGEGMVVGAKCQGNTGKFQGNVWEWLQSARGMLGMQGNARVMYASGCIVPVEGRGLPVECKGVGVKY